MCLKEPAPSPIKSLNNENVVQNAWIMQEIGWKVWHKMLWQVSEKYQETRTFFFVAFVLVPESKGLKRCKLQGTSPNCFQQSSTKGHRSDDHIPPFHKQCLKRQIYIRVGTEAIILPNRLLLKPLSSKQVFTKVLLASRLTIIFLQVLKTYWK